MVIKLGAYVWESAEKTEQGAGDGKRTKGEGEQNNLQFYPQILGNHIFRPAYTILYDVHFLTSGSAVTLLFCASRSLEN